MFRQTRRRTVRWRRVAQFEPIRVEGAPIVREDTADRQSGRAAAHAGMRVVLTRDPDKEHDLNIVVVESLDEQRLGYLPAEVADWVAPLLDSGRVVFDGRIYAIEPAGPGATNGTDSFYLTLTQFERRLVEQVSLALLIRSLLHIPGLGVSWCLGQVTALYHAFSRTPAPPSDR